MAHVAISGVLKDEGLLKDISVTGCCIECAGTADIKPNTRYQLEIKPEATCHIGDFQLETETKWVRGGGGDVTEVGLSIIASPKGKQFQNYVDYLAYRHLNP